MKTCHWWKSSIIRLSLTLHLLLWGTLDGFHCPDYCNQRGICLEYGKCQCHNGFSGPSCASADCPTGRAWADVASGTDVAHAPVPCSNRGTCDSTTGTCTCDTGFTGQACERMSCSCNGHGECLSMRHYARTKDPGLGSSVFVYDLNWDADKIHGCRCDAGFAGYNCLERVCPEGDDPLTTSQVNAKQEIACTATGGSMTLTFRGKTTATIAHDATKEQVKAKLESLSTITEVTVTYTGITTTACTTAGNIIRIEFTQEFGDVPNVVVDTSALIHSSDGVEPSAVQTTSTTGTKESALCSNRGTCNRELGYCACYTSYVSSNGAGGEGTRGDCGRASGSISACPGATACSGHGTCSGGPSYTCTCHSGYTGGDCSEKDCPTGSAWFDLPSADNVAHALAECSNAGTCDRTTGICTCAPGFTGSSCNRLSCPADCTNDQGTCTSMKVMADNAPDAEGNAASWTYGQSGLSATWDSEMIQGCVCGSAFHGHDCAKRTCPTGDDPMTLGQFHEVQTITCQGTTGVFQLSFRQATTSSLNFDVSAANLKSALEALGTIGTVVVTYSSGTDEACANGNTISVTFWNNFGDLPLLTVTQTDLTSFVIVETTKGSKEEVTCSNRGTCDKTTGICRCVEGFTSSNGNGGVGNRGDCGYKEPVYVGSAAQVSNTAG